MSGPQYNNSDKRYPWLPPECYAVDPQSYSRTGKKLREHVGAASFDLSADLQSYADGSKGTVWNGRGA